MCLQRPAWLKRGDWEWESLARAPKMDGGECVLSILQPVGSTEGLEPSGGGSLKEIQQLLWAGQMGGGCCCFGPDWQGWWKLGDLGVNFVRTSLSPPSSEVGHEGKCPEESVGLGSWECGGAFHGWQRETEGKTSVRGRRGGGDGGVGGACLVKYDLQNL